MDDKVVFTRMETSDSPDYRVKIEDDDGTQFSRGILRLKKSAFGNQYITAALATGIETYIEYRRSGNVRKMLDCMFDKADENGALVSFLHPFSFGYYRKFGYEKVCDHLIIRCPLRCIDFVPRGCSLVKFQKEEQIPDLIAIYEEFSKGRNILFQRKNDALFRDRLTYICYEDGKPAAYITYHTTINLVINHKEGGVITVEEIAYTTPSSLRKIFSFLRLYEGEMEEIEFSNCAICPEVDLILRHYTHTSYRLLPDMMARVLDTAGMLRANSYPEKPGAFVVRVTDTRARVNGVFGVEYGNGDCEVCRKDDSTVADLELTAQAFVRLIYGYDGVNAAAAAYLDGIKINNDCTDFFRAFPKRPCGLFEHA